MAWLLRRKFHSYDPAAGSKIEHTSYVEGDIGGLSIVTKDPAQAKQFATRTAALAFLNSKLPSYHYRALRTSAALYEHQQ